LFLCLACHLKILSAGSIPITSP